MKSIILYEYLSKMALLEASRILYEDNHLIAVNKLPGELVQADDSGDIPLSEEVKLYIKEKYNKPGNVFCGVVHRIDRPVSGVVIFARTSKALERMNAKFKERDLQKIYMALVIGAPPDMEDTLIHYLTKDQKVLRTNIYDKPVDGSVRAELSYKVIQKSGKNTLLEVNPVTGRKHQIRVQLASMNCPIVGDLKYGAPQANPDKSICLHAHKLIFNHPVTKEALSLVSPIPDTWKV